MDTPSIVIVAGPPGAGKTTTAAILAARSPRTAHLESDAFFRFISSGYVDPWKEESHEQNETVMRIVAAAAAGYASAGYLTVIDGMVIPGFFFEPLRDDLLDAGHGLAYAVLRPSLSTCQARVQEREGAPPVETGVIEQLWRSFADLGELERNVIAVDGADPEQAADRLELALSDGRLTV